MFHNLFKASQKLFIFVLVILIKLNACWLNVNSFKGQIITDLEQSIELINLCDLSPNDKWSLLYRATRDGFRKF